MIKGVIIVNAHGQARLVKIYNNEVCRLFSDLFVTRLWRCPPFCESTRVIQPGVGPQGSPPVLLHTHATTLVRVSCLVLTVCVRLPPAHPSLNSQPGQDEAYLVRESFALVSKRPESACNFFVIPRY